MATQESIEIDPRVDGWRIDEVGDQSECRNGPQRCTELGGRLASLQ